MKNFETEPLGSSAPKFPTETRSQTTVAQGLAVAVVCPAQAHPTPRSRLELFKST